MFLTLFHISLFMFVLVGFLSEIRDLVKKSHQEILEEQEKTREMLDKQWREMEERNYPKQ